MITRELIGNLRCPYCGYGLEPELEVPGSSEKPGIRFGIIRCACYRYPIIEGIAILRQCSGSADTLDESVAYIERGDYSGALSYALYYDSPIEPVHGRLKKAAAVLGLTRSRAFPDPATLPATFRQALQLYRPQSYGDYLLYRNANNSFLAAIPLLLLLRRIECDGARPARFLDLNCGVGHASFLVRTLFPDIACTATDHDFVNLYLAHRYIIPETPCLVLDAELPLPFSDGSFDAMLCLDGLHYVRSKRALLKELDRCLTESAIWLFPHIHNALQKNVSAGVPLKPSDYQRCFDFLPARLSNETDIFCNFMQGGILDLSVAVPVEELDRAPVLSVVASRRPDIFRKHERLVELLMAARQMMAVNPIYAQEGTRLRMRWPTAALEQECASVKQFLPEQCDLDTELCRSLENGTVHDEDRMQLERLINSFVLVPLPKNYI